jgi:hypothetical protein
MMRLQQQQLLKPFDLFVKGAATCDWLAALDDFRPWLIRAG